MGSGVPYKILIVEDHEDSAAMLETLLQMTGYETFSARNGQEGYTLALNGKPDLIITDIEMPVLDGISFIQRLRETPQFAATPIIVITAYGDERAQRAMEAGADAWASKPFNWELLQQTVAMLLSDYTSTAPL